MQSCHLTRTLSLWPTGLADGLAWESSRYVAPWRRFAPAAEPLWVPRFGPTEGPELGVCRRWTGGRVHKVAADVVAVGLAGQSTCSGWIFLLGARSRPREGLGRPGGGGRLSRHVPEAAAGGAAHAALTLRGCQSPRTSPQRGPRQVGGEMPEPCCRARIIDRQLDRAARIACARGTTAGPRGPARARDRSDAAARSDLVRPQPDCTRTASCSSGLSGRSLEAWRSCLAQAS
jgi:hypothetical protein